MLFWKRLLRHRAVLSPPQPFLFLPIKRTVIQRMAVILGQQQPQTLHKLRVFWSRQETRVSHKDTCLHRLWAETTWPAETHGPAAFVYLCSTFKNWFLATGFTKARDILVVLSRHCKVKTKTVSPLYSVKSLCEHFNKTIYSSHLVPIWRSSQKLRKKKKNPQISHSNLPNAPPTPTPEQKKAKRMRK